MKLRRLTIALLLILVMSMIFEVGDAKKKNRGGKKRRKNKKKLTTTTAETTTEQEETTAINVTKIFYTSSLATKMTMLTPPTMLQNSTEQENIFNVASTGLISIIDDIFEFADNSSYLNYDEFTTAESPQVPLYCEDLQVRQIMMDHLLQGNLGYTDLRKLQKEGLTPREKLKLANETLVKYGLTPLPPCIGKSQPDVVASSSLPVSPTTTEMFTTPSSNPTTAVVEPLPTCASLGIRLMITGYFLRGAIPYAELRALQQSSASPAEKIKLTNATLIKNNLPPLKPCIPKTPSTVPKTTTTTVQTTETSASISTTTSATAQTTTKLPTTTMLPATTTEKPTVSPAAPASTAATQATAAAVETTTSEPNSPPEPPKLPSCDSLGIPAIMAGHILRDEIPISDVARLRESKAGPRVKLMLTNATLIKNNLPPLKPCVVKSVEKEATATVADSSALEGATETPKDDKNSTPPTTTEQKFVTTKSSPPASAKPVHSDECDTGTIQQTIMGYIATGQIDGSSLQEVADPSLSNAEKLRRINKVLADAGLPLIDCGETEANQMSPTAPSCDLKVNVSDHGSLLALVRDMEEEGVLPEGTSSKILEGEITLNEAKEMVMDAAVEAGRIPEECKEAEPPTPKTLGVSQMEQLNKLQAIIKAGFLPPDTLTQLALGHITKEWLRANLSRNEDYILSQMPDAIAQLVRDGQMPPEIVAEIFSGSANRTKIMVMIVKDDDLVRKLLPEKLRNMLGEKPVPMDLKLLLVSGKNETEIRSEIENNEELLQQMMSPSSYFFYNLFKSELNRTINVAISIAIIVVLVFVMTSLGCTMTISKIAEHAKKPKGVIIALVAQFIIMPASAYALTVLFKLETFAAIAVLICGCCPGGNLSNMLAYALDGDMNLSILMTTCSSIIGLGMMPLSLYLYSQLIVPVGSSVVPYDKIIINIACTILPVTVGIAIRHYRPQWTTYVMRFGALMLVLCTIVVAVLSGIMLGDAFFLYFDTSVLACCAILPMTGYTLGYVFAFIAREDPKCRRTICVETGCQNVQLCSTVLKLAFDPILVGVLFLMPLVYMAFQTAEAFLMVLFFRLYNRWRNPKKVIEDENNSEEIKKLDSDSEKGSSSKVSEEIEEKKALTDSEAKSGSSPDSAAKSKDTESDIVELWPLDNTPSPAYLDSFKAAGTENFV